MEVLGDPTQTALDPEIVELAELHELDAAVDDARRRIGHLEQPIEEVFPPLPNARSLSSSSSTVKPGGRSDSIGNS